MEGSEKVFLIAKEVNQIPEKFYYFKKGNVYIASKVKSIAGKLNALMKRYPKRKVFYIFLDSERVLYINLDTLEIKSMNHSVDFERAIRMNFPDILVVKLEDFSPDFEGIREKEGKISKKVVARTVIYGVLAVFMISAYTYIKWKERKEEESFRVPEVSVQNVPPPPSCFSNLEKFSENYVFGVKVISKKNPDGSIQVFLEYETKDGGILRVDLTPSSVKPKGEISITRLADTKIAVDTATGDLIVEQKDYLKCLELIEKNSNQPIVVEELSDEGCYFRIVRGCFDSGYSSESRGTQI